MDYITADNIHDVVSGLFMDNTAVKAYLLLCNRSVQTKEMNKLRQNFGQYFSLFPILRRDPEEFKKYMRMSIETFDYILEGVTPLLRKNWNQLHTRAIGAEERLVVTLRFLATGATYESLKFTFFMGKSTIAGIIKETVVAIRDAFHETHMSLLNRERLRNIAEGFQRAVYFNYKHYFSIVLQAQVDAYGRFASIDVGGFGQQSDGGTFATSDLYTYIEDGDIVIPRAEKLPGTNIWLPHFFIGDDAYLLALHTLKAYSGKALSLSQRNFNEFFNGIRRIVECAFGMMTNKFRMLLTTLHQHPKTVDHLVRCICLLHDIIIDREGLTGDEPHGRVRNIRVRSCPRNLDRQRRLGGSGVQAREDLRTYLDSRK
ncbi:hypothetical protein QAD02_000505 [Eretmocerus hayati]|uniref:Uncharacterized protein n=1 Tax=Eretmocerus hayati TaxID=131215 RepID=A0ACC2NDS1_9HYME|nr:hypothetical protein QAD02_000505 [Eretmocerus hayati]